MKSGHSPNLDRLAAAGEQFANILPEELKEAVMKWHEERPDRLRDRVMPEAHVGMFQCNVTLSNAAFQRLNGTLTYASGLNVTH